MGQKGDSYVFFKVDSKHGINEIVYETPFVSIFNTTEMSSVTQEFCYYIKNKLNVSRDGVYWNALKLSDDFVSVKKAYILNSDFVLETRYWRFKFPLEQIYQGLPNSVQTYVKFNNNILGFDTLSVAEDDYTLVPMRFLQDLWMIGQWCH